ncbi:MAG: hypothetical protein WDM91_10530 [Rhizomicrobium sp.]
MTTPDLENDTTGTPPVARKAWSTPEIIMAKVATRTASKFAHYLESSTPTGTQFS